MLEEQLAEILDGPLPWTMNTPNNPQPAPGDKVTSPRKSTTVPGNVRIGVSNPLSRGNQAVTMCGHFIRSFELCLFFGSVWYKIVQWEWRF